MAERTTVEDIRKLIDEYVEVSRRKTILEAFFADGLAPLNNREHDLRDAILGGIMETGAERVSSNGWRAVQVKTSDVIVKDPEKLIVWLRAADLYDQATKVDFVKPELKKAIKAVQESGGDGIPGAILLDRLSVRIQSE